MTYLLHNTGDRLTLELFEGSEAELRELINLGMSFVHLRAGRSLVLRTQYAEQGAEHGASAA